MAPKRHRGESSSSRPQYDRDRFVSLEAANHYEQYLSGKSLIPERGLRPHAIHDGEMSEQIMERGWYTFTEQPEPAVIAVVKEFYANAIDEPPYATQVRGHRVEFSSAAINHYYHIQPPEECRYTQYMDGGPDYDRIVRELCQPGTDWTYKGPRGGAYFASKHLSRYGKIWYAFLCAKLMPALHVSDVPKERAVLLFAMVKDWKINVGDVIELSIRRCLDDHFSGGLPHPSLICGLCYRAGVRWNSEEPVKRPMNILDHGLIARYSVWDGAESHPRGRGFFAAQQQAEPIADDDPTAAQEAPSTSRPPRARSSRQFRDLHDMIHGCTQRLERQNQRLAERQDHIFNYQTSFNASLVDMFARMAPHVDNVHFPVPQPLPVYPPPDDEEDAAADDDDDDDTIPAPED